MFLYIFTLEHQQYSFFLVLSEELLSASCYISHNFSGSYVNNVPFNFRKSRYIALAFYRGKLGLYIYCFNIESLVHPFYLNRGTHALSSIKMIYGDLLMYVQVHQKLQH